MSWKDEAFKRIRDAYRNQTHGMGIDFQQVEDAIYGELENLQPIDRRIADRRSGPTVERRHNLRGRRSNGFQRRKT